LERDHDQPPVRHYTSTLDVDAAQPICSRRKTAPASPPSRRVAVRQRRCLALGLARIVRTQQPRLSARVLRFRCGVQHRGDASVPRCSIETYSIHCGIGFEGTADPREASVLRSPASVLLEHDRRFDSGESVVIRFWLMWRHVTSSRTMYLKYSPCPPRRRNAETQRHLRCGGHPAPAVA